MKIIIESDDIKKMTQLIKELEPRVKYDKIELKVIKDLEEKSKGKKKK